VQTRQPDAHSKVAHALRRDTRTHSNDTPAPYRATRATPDILGKLLREHALLLRCRQRLHAPRTRGPHRVQSPQS
jgi:hypothetical protein